MSVPKTPRKLVTFLTRGRVMLLCLALMVLLIGTGAAAYSTLQNGSAPTTTSAPVGMPIVAALGRIEPKSRVVKVAPPSGVDGPRVEQLLVAEGDFVEAGQVLAVLDIARRREQAWREAETRVAVAEARLKQIEAGPKPGDVAAQEALILRWKSEFDRTQHELDRSQALFDKGIQTSSDLETRRADRNTARQTLEQAQSTLVSLREVRQVDLNLQRAEIASSRASAERALAEYEIARLKAPFAAQVLRIQARPGEKIGDNGILELGDTRRMQVVAEVYEGDIAKVFLGAAVTARCPTTGAELRGSVAELGWIVARKTVLTNDPVSDTDARVIEVRIDLFHEDSTRAAGLSNARVDVLIETAMVLDEEQMISGGTP